MKLEIGDTITLLDNEKFSVIDILEVNGRDFLYLVNIKSPEKSWIYEYKNENGNMKVKKENDEKIIEQILELMKSKAENIE